MNEDCIHFAFAFLSLSSAADDPELAKCKCWEGYQPQKWEKRVQCFGILLLNVQDCNVPERPKCVCSGNVTGILSDSSGVWCSEYTSGKDHRKWECENKEDWAKFYAENPKEKP
ncbi:hypothetical protein NQ318_002819 [Aromia moschata]|uniref:Uncharacterized protein n=1 Tax=Aromia moschata TaxID=1265417 RepID=A0AAV8X5D7_9CUCU|nr:hypothetical protein NQ318_002819 [Aromia moschata]